MSIEAAGTTDAMTIYGDSRSGNCLKPRYVADRLGLAYRWHEVSVLKAETRTPEFLAMNPAGQVPLVRLADGRLLAQSNAIMLYLAEGSDLIPPDRYTRAQMMQWLFWEQYSHETCIAVRRYQKSFLHKPEAEIDPALMVKGNAALALMDRHLADRAFFVGEILTLADVALVAYTRVAPEGGFDLEPVPSVRLWIARVEAGLGLAPVGHRHDSNHMR